MTDTKASQIPLPAADASRLLQWMRSVGHVERNLALDLMHQGRLTKLHERYFHAAILGQSYSQFRHAVEGD